MAGHHAGSCIGEWNMNTDNKISMKVSNWIRNLLMIISIVLLVLTVMPNFAQDYGVIENGEGSATVVEGTGAKSISRQEMRRMMADILLGEEQEEPVVDDAVEVSYDQGLIDSWEQTRTGRLSEQVAKLIRKFPDYPHDISAALAKSTTPEIGWTGWQVVLTIILSIVISIVIEQVTVSKLLGRLYAYVNTQEKTTVLKFKFILVRVVIQLVGVGMLALIAYGCAIYFKHDNSFFQLLFTQIISALVMLRLWMILLRSIFSPVQPTLRPIPMDDSSSKQLFLWFILFFFVIEFGEAFFEYMNRAGLSEALLNGLLIPYTLVLNLIIFSRIWSMRQKITDMFSNGAEETQDHSVTRSFLATIWPFLFTAWLLSLWMLWLYNSFLGQTNEAGYISISWWITLAFFVADRIFYALVKNVVNITWLHSPTFATRSRRFINVVQNGFRILIVAVSVYMFSLAWGVQNKNLMTQSFGKEFLGQSINLVVIAVITYVIWEFFNALIERSLPEEPDAIAALEGEGGGEGATRAETLLPLMRTTLTVILVTFVTLSVLHSFGIAITPLLAGAGVVGIAIGFGAQKLVQDILSGIFFLVDDAFRKNEYIEIEDLRGTVEKISLRSMQLRHHLGAVQTIPYGEIKTVKNLSRDWFTMKLELRLSYDTDIEQVRKIIKKVGQEMLADEHLGPGFILPLKSQGVMRVEESALIFRMKFTTKPGEQWVIRREAYRRVRDALSDAGIFFAHREVRVRLPEDQLAKGVDPEKPEIKEALTKAAAAAGDIIASDEAKKNNKIDWENEM